MSVRVEAVYENGTLRLDRPLPLHEGQKLTLVIEHVEGPIKRSRGLLRWEGDPKELERLALDPEVD